MKNCNDCKHCPKNWRELSQLPLCDHPAAVNVNGNAAWSLYSIHGGHCGEKLKHFEKKRDTEMSMHPPLYNAGFKDGSFAGYQLAKKIPQQKSSNCAPNSPQRGSRSSGLELAFLLLKSCAAQ